VDIAGRDYWERVWRDRRRPSFVDLSGPGARDYPRKCLYSFLRSVLAGEQTRGKKLIEIGCGNSVWLPHFARYFGYDVFGLDYTPSGCARARAILQHAGEEGTIIEGNLFDPPAELVGDFDVVTSFGVVEHFRDTAACLAACARLVKPGGIIITEIPNLSGLLGWLQKLIDRQVYDVHVPLDRRQLALAHAQAGLSVIQSRYLVTVNFGALNWSGYRQAIHRIAARLCLYPSAGVWVLEELGMPSLPNRLTSPYIVCVARKPDSRSERDGAITNGSGRSG
jgi:SAM-dependent methyltransferase